VVHERLEGAVGVGECFGTAAEAHLFAEVVSAGCAVVAFVAHDPCLDGHSLADRETLHSRAHCSDDTGCFVTENKWSLEGNVAIPAVEIIMH
jgi:hypothetical protein